MKLLSCYIEGYGKIKQRRYDFSDGITVFCEENGEGKTTLASFIKAMFYGLKGYRRGSTEFCDREHFYPFDGGRFGGNLTFFWRGKRYKIERFFGERSETADTLRAFENGEMTAELGDEPGKTVFGMDRESFERTVFLDSGEVEIASTSGIHARLNAFLEGVDEEGNLDGALSALDKAAKAYKKSRTGADNVSAETAKIAKLNEEILNAVTVKRALEGKYAREKALKEEIVALNERIVASQEANEKLSQFEHLDSILEGLQRAKNALATVERKYPNGLPSLEEAEAFNAYVVAGNGLRAKLDGKELSSADEEKLNALSLRFQGGEPSESELHSIEKKIQLLSALETEMKFAEGRSLSQKEEELLAKFDKKAPSDEEMRETAEKVEKYKRLRSEWETTPVYVGEKAVKKKLRKGYAYVGAFAAALALVGGVLLALQNSLGGALLTVGAVGLLADGFLYLNAKSGGQVRDERENPARMRIEKEVKELEDAVKATLLPMGYRSTNGLAYDFALLEGDLSSYRRLRADECARAAELREKRATAERVSLALSTFFENYGLSGAPFYKLSADLRLCQKEYADLRSRRSLVGAERARIEGACRENQEKIDAFKNKYALVEVENLVEDIRSAIRLRGEIADGEKRAEAFKLAKGLGERTARPKADLGELQFFLQAKQSEKSKLDREIAEDERLVENLDGYEADKAEAEALLKEYKRKHRLLSAAAELLKKADGRLKDRYVSPLKEEFLYYARLIEGALGESVSMTKDFELRFERNGVERSERHLSSGQRTICALCFRLALVKNMYEGELPFLILDDPFTSLDETHFRKVAAVLKELSKGMQTVYFTCHESRKP